MTTSFINQHLGLSPSNPKSFDEVDASAMKKLKSSLEPYSVELGFLYKQLHWKKIEDSYPIAIFTSVLYLGVWQFSIPLLCLFFVSLQVLVILDYFHAKLGFNSKKHDGISTESLLKEFDDLCRSLLMTKQYMRNMVHSYFVYKEENPFGLCGLTSALLICLAVLSKLMGDILFSFLVLNLVLYYPGLKANGYVNRASVWFFTNVTNVLRTFQGKKEKST
uniref:RETREG1-3/ARL6IP-like N-terminal reticulon-homology domain-containing protein n=1 Tax=Cacopsylla melanoneura TaxID=428564 RepID=A0A8D8TP22_9HEMI